MVGNTVQNDMDGEYAELVDNTLRSVIMSIKKEKHNLTSLVSA